MPRTLFLSIATMRLRLENNAFAMTSEKSPLGDFSRRSRKALFSLAKVFSKRSLLAPQECYAFLVAKVAIF